MAMGIILFVVSALSFLYGMSTEAAATSAIHQILAGIGILGGIVALAGAGACLGLHSILAELKHPKGTEAASPSQEGA